MNQVCTPTSSSSTPENTHPAPAPTPKYGFTPGRRLIGSGSSSSRSSGKKVGCIHNSGYIF